MSVEIDDTVLKNLDLITDILNKGGMELFYQNPDKSITKIVKKEKRKSNFWNKVLGENIITIAPTCYIYDTWIHINCNKTNAEILNKLFIDYPTMLEIKIKVFSNG